MTPDRRRRGSALIEVLIALVLLSVAGTGLVTMLGQTAHTLRQLRVDEQLTRRASAQLDRLVLWNRSDFLARLGKSRVGDWTLSVNETTPELFDVSIAETDTSIVLLRTTLYRPATTDVVFP